MLLLAKGQNCFYQVTVCSTFYNTAYVLKDMLRDLGFMMIRKQRFCIVGRLQNSMSTIAEMENSFPGTRKKTDIDATINSIASRLSRCDGPKDLLEGKRLHERIVQFGLEKDRFLRNHLVQMYGKCRSLQEAREVFDNTADRNTFSWNLMTAAYIENGKLEEAAKLFQHMPKRDVVSWTTMISAYAQLGHVAEALRLFKEMPHRNVVSWTAMITAYAQAGQMTEAYDLFVQMPYRDVVAWNAVIAGYAQQGQLEEALSMFHRMPRRNIVSWTAMITGYAQHGKLRETLQLFQQMQLEGLMPDKVTFISIFEACANHAALAEGEEIHKRITGSNFEFDVVLSTAILNMYAKCGNLGTARAVFDRMPERNVISWNAMMQAYAYHGSGRETIQLFYKMVVECVLPNDITFATILSASSHAGLINEGYHFLSSISFDYGLTPKLDHYNCVIDLLGRAGRLAIAEELLSSIPYQPSDGSWTTLLGSCKISSTEPSYDHNKTL